MSRIRLLVSTLLLVALVVALIGISGCTPATKGTGDGGGSSGESGSAAEPPEGSGSETETAGELPYAASEMIPFIRTMGVSHKGEKLIALVRTVHPSKDAATKALTEALPSFGDLVTYFVIEPTEHLQGSGLPAGQWVVAEFYRKTPSAENVELDSRGVDKVQSLNVTVTCDEPIPVFEDLQPEGQQ